MRATTWQLGPIGKLSSEHTQCPNTQQYTKILLTSDQSNRTDWVLLGLSQQQTECKTPGQRDKFYTVGIRYETNLGGTKHLIHIFY